MKLSREEKIKILRGVIKKLEAKTDKLDCTNVLDNEYYTIYNIRLVKYYRILDKLTNQ